jgi:DinB superfamily
MTQEILNELQTTSTELMQLLSSCKRKQLNAVPLKDSWTAGQVAEHITKSNAFIVQSLNAEGNKTERKPDERVEELKKTFLDFTIKMQSPDFILPTQDTYQKETITADLKKSIKRVKDTGSKVNLYEIIDHPVFKEITKLELLHFVLYHTQRHIHQLKIILHNKTN